MVSNLSICCAIRNGTQCRSQYIEEQEEDNSDREEDDKEGVNGFPLTTVRWHPYAIQ